MPPARAPRHGLMPAVMALITCAVMVLLPTACTRDAPSPLRLGIAYGHRLVGLSDQDLGAALDEAVGGGDRWVRAGRPGTSAFHPTRIRFIAVKRYRGRRPDGATAQTEYSNDDSGIFRDRPVPGV